MIGWIIGFSSLAALAFLMFIPSDDPKSWRSQTKYWMEHDSMWKFTLHLILWGCLVGFILLGLFEMLAFH